MNNDFYPNQPGFYQHAPSTSREAAESIAETAGSIRARVLTVILASGPSGIIADDVAEATELNVYQVRARISELHARKSIADSGRRGVGVSGRRAAVWVAIQYAPETEEDDPQGSLLDAARWSR